MSRFTSILTALTIVAVPLPALAQRAQQQQQQQQGGSSLFGSNALQSGQQGSSGLTGGTSGSSGTNNGGSSGGSRSSSSTGTSTGGQFGAGRAEMGDVFGRASDQGGFIGRGTNDQQQSGNGRNSGGRNSGGQNGGRSGNNRGQSNGRNNRNTGNNGGFSFNNGFSQQNSGNSRQGGSGGRSQTVRPVYRMAIDAPVAQPGAAAQQVSSRLRSQGATSPLARVSAVSTGATLVLQGQVASEYDRRLAEQVARLEPGIGAIDNQIVVGSQP